MPSTVLMSTHTPALQVLASDRFVQTVAEALVAEVGYTVVQKGSPSSITLIADQPALWALKMLERMPKRERARSIVVTTLSHPIYQDLLTGMGIGGIIRSLDAAEMQVVVLAVSLNMSTQRLTSGLTKTELRIVRLLLGGYATNEIARRLRVKCSTVNTHCSSILQKAECCDRAQLIVKILSSFVEHLDNKPEAVR